MFLLLSSLLLSLKLANTSLWSKKICLSASRNSELWTDKFHSHLKSQKFLDTTSVIDDPIFMIINNPSVTLCHPVIEMDIKSIMEKILGSEVLPDTRLKEMFAIVTGMGRGKTRCLLEVDRALRQCNQGVISVAITYNGFTADIPKPFPAVRDNYVLSIISRIISNYYRICFEKEAFNIADKVMQDMATENNMDMGDASGSKENQLTHKSKYRNMDSYDHKILIRSLIRHIVLEQRKIRPVERFVLLVDEAKKAEESLEKGVHDVLRQALLDEQIMEVGEEPLIVDLVMSSLSISSTGVNESGRLIKSLTVPPYLPARLVLDSWVKAHIPDISFSDARSEQNLLSLISCISPLPRAIQLMVEVMKKDLTSPITIDASRIRSLYLDTVMKIKEYYPALESDFLRPKYARALLFGENLYLDDEVMALISSGVFTNAVEKISSNTSIVPQTSIVAMSSLPRGYSYNKEICKMISSLTAFLGDSSLQASNSGRPLEIVIQGLITAKLVVLTDVFQETRITQRFSLFSLFRQQQKFEDAEGFMSIELFNILRDNNFVMGGDSFKPEQLSSSYSRNRDEVREEFLAELTQVVLEKASCKVVHLDVKDFADAAWMLRTETGDPFLLFVDGKSSRINMVGKGHLPPSTQPCQMTDLPGNGKQASRLLNIASMTETLANVREGSMADALKKGRYLFVYMNTGRPSQTFGVGNKILHIGGNDAKSFLSFCEEFYYLNRLST